MALRSDVRTLLKREESYAVHSLLYLHDHPGAPTAQMARDLQMPAAFTAKVVQRLVSEGLIESRQGRSGGLSLRVSLEQLSLLDVIEAISGRVLMDTCETKLACPTQQRTGRCRLNGVWVSLTLQLRELFAAVSLADLTESPAAPARRVTP